MTAPPAQTKFVVSLYATPNPIYSGAMYVVLRAGRLIAGVDHLVRRQHFPGHELILCVRGEGWVKIAGTRHAVRAGDMVWEDCRNPHEHGPNPADPWEVYWLRAEGPGLGRLAETIRVAEDPVTHGVDTAAAVSLFEKVFELMGAQDLGPSIQVSALVAQLIALTLRSRQPRASDANPACPAVLLPAFQRIRLFFFEPIHVEQLAVLCGMSASHFSRLFKSAFGAGPNTFLRHERINQAKRRLAESSDSMKEIARQVGYADAFFFSRDFKGVVGVTPRQYRLRESLHRGAI